MQRSRATGAARQSWRRRAAVLLFLSAVGTALCPAAGPLADMEEALEAAHSGDYRTAFAEWLPLAENGDAAASYNLGQLYRTGRGVTRDYARAAYWYRAAAERLHAPAQHNLAILYERGLGVPIDYGEARHWYRRAAEQGHGPAQFNLAVMYSIGQGVTRDLVQAHMWYGLAASQGDESAARNLAEIARRMSAEEIAQARALARDWLERR